MLNNIKPYQIIIHHIKQFHDIYGGISASGQMKCPESAPSSHDPSWKTRR